MFQRAASATTRRARSRSGVISAAVPSPSARCLRKVKAMTRASSWRSAVSINVTLCKSSCGFATQDVMACAHESVVAAGRNARLVNVARLPGFAPSCITSSRFTCHCESSVFKANCGCSGVSAAHDCSSRVWSRPGRTTAPCGYDAMASSKSRVAGLVPVEPAAMMGPRCLPSRIRLACNLIIMLRRALGPMRFSVPSFCGSVSAMTARRLKIAVRWPARSRS